MELITFRNQNHLKRRLVKVRRHKQNFKKSNLGLGSLITESSYMKSNGIVRIWDCGKIKFERSIF
jgi:hypothetical protein